MNASIRSALLTAALALPALANADFISGDITGGGAFAGSVTRDDAWVESNPIDGTEVNFWTLTATAGDRVSITILPSGAPPIEFGMSLYRGLIELSEVFTGEFDNQADFGDKVFIVGTPFFTAAGTVLLDILLPASGIYTLAVGGEEGGHGAGSFDYTMDVDVAPVPLPAAVWLLASALFGVGGFRRRAMQHTSA